jgi:sec-independent protein translocase protein TatB
VGNLGGGEVLVILLVALIVLGPTKLPPAIRQIGRVVGEIRRIGQGFQQELREAAQPLQETKEVLKTADKEFRQAAEKPIEEMKDTLKAADKEFRQAAEKPIEEMKDTLKAADKEFREATGEPEKDRQETSKAADNESSDGLGESSPNEPDSGSENAA